MQQTEPQNFNIYCDESTHLENDGMPFMVLGAIICPVDKTKQVSQDLRNIKVKHDLHQGYEAKWTSISRGKLDFYKEFVDYFFDNDMLSLRVVIADKRGLDHESYSQTHDDWYYKIYFQLLKELLKVPTLATYCIYLDIKDTLGADKIEKLHQILSNNMGDFYRQRLKRMQHIRSHEVQQVQLVDILIGAINCANRRAVGKNPCVSESKVALIEHIKARSGHNPLGSTARTAVKFNLFHWQPQPPEVYHG